MSREDKIEVYVNETVEQITIENQQIVEEIDIAVYPVVEKVEVSVNECITVINVISGAAIDPANYDLSQFKNQGTNYFLKKNDVKTLQGETLIGTGNIDIFPEIDTVEQATVWLDENVVFN